MRFSLRRPKRLKPTPEDIQDRLDAESAKNRARRDYHRITKVVSKIREGAEALREDRVRNHYADALAYAFTHRTEEPQWDQD